MGGEVKEPALPLTSFTLITSTNVGISPKNFLTYSFNSFPAEVKNLKVIPISSPELLNLDQDYPSKKWFFWSNPHKIGVMITCLIGILELQIFGHMTKSAI